ncbi:MAG: hypothetical protein H8D45_24330 [Bacteroidetes bacterium]|nr:hypothetical protein [Bacteroidota bacterium]
MEQSIKQQKTCKECYYYSNGIPKSRFNPGNCDGLCKRFPPTIITIGHLQTMMYSRVHNSWTCGEFMQSKPIDRSIKLIKETKDEHKTTIPAGKQTEQVRSMQTNIKPRTLKKN